MKVTNISPKPVSILINVKGKDQRLDLQPGESMYSNGLLNSLFNKTLRVFRQKGLIEVTDENDLVQMAKEEADEKALILAKEALLKEEEEEKKAVKQLKGNAFDNTDLLPDEPVYHPDVLIVVPKKEVDYSANVLPDPEETKEKKGKKTKKE